jgi:hypothetical protein
LVLSQYLVVLSDRVPDGLVLLQQNAFFNALAPIFPPDD